MFVKPTGLAQAVAVTRLKTFLKNERFERAIRHTRNPCGEILLRESLDVHILEQEVLRWVGEPGMTRYEGYQLIGRLDRGIPDNEVLVSGSQAESTGGSNGTV